MVLIYSGEIITRKSAAQAKPLLLYGVYPRNFAMRIFLGKFLRKYPISVDASTRFFCERFLGISTDFPQNCYLGKRREEGEIEMREEKGGRSREDERREGMMREGEGKMREVGKRREEGIGKRRGKEKNRRGRKER